MKHRLIILLLFTAVLPFVLSLPRIYFLIQELKTWSDAQTYCRARYIDLAVITTTVEMNNLQTAAQKYQFSSSAWIGLYTNINTWHWTMNKEPLGSFTAWKPGQPDNANGNELCAYLHENLWSDRQCIWRLGHVCFDNTKSGSNRYIFYSEYKSWHDAQNFCRQYHTDLASARDATENSVMGALDYWYWTWVGLTRDPWKWTDQTTDVSVITWSSGDSNDYLMNKSCATMSNSVADYEHCSTPMPFFCYSYPKKQQIIRIQFKSSQVEIDPSITESIEEKLKLKLEEHGMRNITVTWRKQPDGEVFHKEENITKDITYAEEDCDDLYFVAP